MCVYVCMYIYIYILCVCFGPVEMRIFHGIPRETAREPPGGLSGGALWDVRMCIYIYIYIYIYTYYVYLHAGRVCKS